MRAGAALRAGISGNEDFPWVSGNPVVDAKTKLSDGGLGETALPMVRWYHLPKKRLESISAKTRKLGTSIQRLGW